MNIMLSAQHKVLGVSECQRLCGRSSTEIDDLAFQGGFRSMPGEPLSVPIGSAINMLVISTMKDYGVQALSAWLPGLRNEALLKLGENISNWSFETAEAQKRVLPTLYGNRDAVRPPIASLLGCYLDTTTRQFRFHSQSDVECLSNSQLEQGHSGRTPRFTIDAHDLAERVQTTCSGPLFTVKAVAPA